MKKLRLFGLSVVVFALMVPGCDTGVNDEKDTWGDVASLSQLNGTWKGSFSQTMTYKDFIEDDGGTWTSEMAAAVGDMKVTIVAETIMTIDAGAKTLSMSGKTIMSYSGSKVAGMWGEEFKEMLKEAFTDTGAEVSFEDKTHSIIIAMDVPEDTIPDDWTQDFQINQNGRKLKAKADPDAGGAPEMIFIRQ